MPNAECRRTTTYIAHFFCYCFYYWKRQCNVTDAFCSESPSEQNEERRQNKKPLHIMFHETEQERQRERKMKLINVKLRKMCQHPQFKCYKVETNARLLTNVEQFAVSKIASQMICDTNQRVIDCCITDWQCTLYSSS